MEIIGFLKGAGLPGGESFTNDTDMYIIWHFSSEEGEEKNIYIKMFKHKTAYKPAGFRGARF